MMVDGLAWVSNGLPTHSFENNFLKFLKLTFEI